MDPLGDSFDMSIKLLKGRTKAIELRNKGIDLCELKRTLTLLRN